MGTDTVVAASVKRVIAHPDFEKNFKHPVKFNGTDFVEQRLSGDEQAAEVGQIANTKLHIFLERYGTLLNSEDLRALQESSAASTEEARIWLGRLMREPLSQSSRHKQCRRRRWTWCRREMALNTGFFSEEEMKRRDPKLFHACVGRYVDNNVRLSTAPMQGSLSGYLMQQLERECEASASIPASATSAPKSSAQPSSEQEPLEQAQKRHKSETPNDLPSGERSAPAAQEEGSQHHGDEDSISDLSDNDSGGETEGKEVNEGGEVTDDAAVRRAKFLKAMRNRFVNGQEKEFQYNAVDDDSDLDDIVELGQDAEERYFDAE